MNDLKSESEMNIYPGAMCMKNDAEEIKHNFKGSVSEIEKSKIKIRESKESMEIDIYIPGVNKEDIYAEICNEELTIRICHISLSGNKESKTRKKLYHRCIKLPKKADGLFTTAVYKNGVLRFLIPKSKTAEFFNNDRIVIY